MRFRLVLVLVAALLAGKEKEKPGKLPAWPPKAGIRTPGIQIAFANLKSEADLTLEGTPNAVFAEGMNVLVPLGDKGLIARIASRDNKAQESWKGFEAPCGGVVSAFGSLWIPDCKKQTVTRMEARGGKVTATVNVPVAKAASAIAATGDSIWILSDEKGTLTRIDPTDNAVLSELRLGAGCNSLGVDAGTLWVTCTADNKIFKINPKTNLVDERIETVAEPVSLAFGEAHVWVYGNKDGKISKIDPKTNKVVATIETGVPAGNGSIAFGDGFVWASASGYPLTKIDAKTDKVMQQFAGEGGGYVKFAAGSIWLTNPAKMQVSRFDPKRIALTLPD